MANQPDESGEPPSTGGSALFNANDPSKTAGSLQTSSHDGPQPSFTSPSVGAETTLCSLLDSVASLLPAKNRRLPASKWEVVAIAEDEELDEELGTPKLPWLKDKSILDSLTECIQQTDYFETYFDLYEAFSVSHELQHHIFN